MGNLMTTKTAPIVVEVNLEPIIGRREGSPNSRAYLLLTCVNLDISGSRSRNPF